MSLQLEWVIKHQQPSLLLHQQSCVVVKVVGFRVPKPWAVCCVAQNGCVLQPAATWQPPGQGAAPPAGAAGPQELLQVRQWGKHLLPAPNTAGQQLLQVLPVAM